MVTAPVRATRLDAIGVKMQRMIADRETAILRDAALTPFDFRVIELFDATALHADEMIVMARVFQLEHRLARLEVMALQKSRVLELGQHAIDRRQSGIEALFGEQAIDVFGGKVPHRALLEQLEDPQSWHGGLEADRFEVVHVAHRSIIAPHDSSRFPSLEQGRHAVSQTFACTARLRGDVRHIFRRAAARPLNLFSVYRMEIQQGNLVEQDMLSQLKPGMSKDQVRAVLGTPLIADMFHDNRWDYVFRRQRTNSTTVEERALAVYLR